MGKTHSKKQSIHNTNHASPHKKGSYGYGSHKTSLNKNARNKRAKDFYTTSGENYTARQLKSTNTKQKSARSIVTLRRHKM